MHDGPYLPRAERPVNNNAIYHFVEGFPTLRRGIPIAKNEKKLNQNIFLPIEVLMRRLFSQNAILLVFVSLCSCSPLNLQVGRLGYGESESYSFDLLFQKSGCQDFKTHVWNYIDKIVSANEGSPIPYIALRKEVTKRVMSLMDSHSGSKEDIKKFADQFVSIYALITEFRDQNKDDVEETLFLFEYDVFNQNETVERRKFKDQLQTLFADLNGSAKKLNKDCAQEDHPNLKIGSQQNEFNAKWLQDMKSYVHPVVYGARKVMATAYQSCKVLDLSIMPSGQMTKGVVRYSNHSDSRGSKRKIVNLDSLNRSHYYLRQAQVPTDKKCFDIHARPLIYDFGGKPSISFRSINLFENSGSGSSVLGVDCSGFISSAMATAGLRLKQHVSIRPIHVKGVSSWVFKKAGPKNLSCLIKQDPSVNNPIQTGDIIASSNHVAIIEFVKEDPFGIEHISNANDCHSQRIKAEEIKFSVIQSSSHNNAVGINRMMSYDAFKNQTIMKGLKRMASRACYKKFGINAHRDIDEISILRHNTTNSDCLDYEVYLKGQDCLKECTPKSI